MKPLSILFTHHGDQWIRGSERVLLDLLHGLDPTRVKPVVWCNGFEFAERVEKMGIPTYRSDFSHYFGYKSPRFDPSRYISLVREGLELTKRHEVCVLHANSAAPAQWLVPVARLAKLPILSHLHIDYLRRGRFTSLLHQADLVVGVSVQVVQDFLRDGVPAARTQVIYNGLDFSRLDTVEGSDLRQALDIPARAVVIAAVGSLIQRKGYDVLLRALQKADPSIDLRLVIAGDGPERSELECLTTELGLNARVHFLGYLDDTPSVYRNSDIVALASRGDAFGLVLAEAGFFGLPVVSTKVGGIPEVIADGVSGILVPPDDPDALAIALNRLAKDAGYRRMLGKAGKERVECMFGTQHMVAEFQDAYERLARIDRRTLGWRSVTASLTPYRRLAGLAVSRRLGANKTVRTKDGRVLS